MSDLSDAMAQEAAPFEESKTVLQYFKEEVQMEEGSARGQLARFLFYGSDVFKAVNGLVCDWLF